MSRFSAAVDGEGAELSRYFECYNVGFRDGEKRFTASESECMGPLTAIYCRHALLPAGWEQDVRIDINPQGCIESLKAEVPAPANLALYDYVIPGMPNVHSHAFQRAMAGLTEQLGPSDDSFWTWREKMFHFVSTLTGEEIASIARRLCGELLAEGYTSLGEFHYLHHQPHNDPYPQRQQLASAIIEAAISTGIRITMLPTLYTYAGFDRSPLRGSQMRFHNSLDELLEIRSRLQAEFSNESRVKIGLAAHSLRAVDPNQLALLAELVESEPDARIHLHVSEQRQEVADCLADRGERPVRWLLDHYPLSSQWCLIHATHLDSSEIVDLAATGAIVGLCPTTEANLGDGIFPAVDFLAAGGKFAIGSDSHICVSPIEELRMLEYGQRLTHLRRNVLATRICRSTGRRLYADAAAYGAEALGWPTGQISTGMLADLVAIDARHPLLTGRTPDQVLDTYVFCGDRTMIDSVWVGGRSVVLSSRQNG